MTGRGSPGSVTASEYPGAGCQVGPARRSVTRRPDTPTGGGYPPNAATNCSADVAR